MGATFEYRDRRRVEFADTDMAGVVHFASFFRHMEASEHAFLRSLGFSVHRRQDGVTYGWPRVHASCDYRSPLRFEDEFEDHLFVVAKRSRSLEYLHVLRRPGPPTDQVVAVGRMAVVCVAIDRESGRFEPVALPADLASRLEAAPPEAYAAYLARPGPSTTPG